MIKPPLELTPNTVADWVEASLLSNGPDVRISDANLLDALEEAGADDAEGHIANLRAEISRRRNLIGARYPLQRRGAGFVFKGPWDAQKYLPYNFLLLISLNQLYRELVFARGSGNVPAELFENIVSAALMRYAGGNAIRIGAPRRNPVPGGFPNAVQHISDRLFETFGYGELEDQQSGDDGVDIVVWKSFKDQLCSQLVILAQCSIGTDWRKKRSELDLSVWDRHIRWATKPMKAFAVPFQHELGNPWQETSVRGGIVLDRGRIVNCLPNPPISAQLQERVTRWCTRRMKAVRALVQ